jgi:hypothetical protein
MPAKVMTPRPRHRATAVEVSRDFDPKRTAATTGERRGAADASGDVRWLVEEAERAAIEAAQLR